MSPIPRVNLSARIPRATLPGRGPNSLNAMVSAQAASLGKRQAFRLREKALTQLIAQNMGPGFDLVPLGAHLYRKGIRNKYTKLAYLLSESPLYSKPYIYAMKQLSNPKTMQKAWASFRQEAPKLSSPEAMQYWKTVGRSDPQLQDWYKDAPVRFLEYQGRTKLSQKGRDLNPYGPGGLAAPYSDYRTLRDNAARDWRGRISEFRQARTQSMEPQPVPVIQSMKEMLQGKPVSGKSLLSEFYQNLLRSQRQKS